MMQGRKPREDWGDGPPKFEVGGRPTHSSPPNILRSSVVGCARKYEKSNKNVFFLWGKGHARRVMYDI